MTRREQVEQVLFTYGVVNQKLVDDLFALFPAPSREELDRLWASHDKRYRSAEEWRAAMKTALMAWATRQPRRVWCKHLRWNDQMDDWQVLPDGVILASVDQWKACPICGRARP